MLPGLGKQGTGDREGGWQQGPCPELSFVQGRDTGAGVDLETGVVAGHGCEVCSAQICVALGTSERGEGETGLDSGRGVTGSAGGTGGWPWGGHHGDGGGGQIGAVFGLLGVRGEAGRKTPTFCKIAVCCLGVLKEPLEKSLRGALSRVSKAWTHCTQCGACILRGAAWSRPVHLGSRQLSTIPDGPPEQVVSPPSCSQNRDPGGSFGRGWSAGEDFQGGARPT